jgi:nicotinate phosphoribosyltransferase
MRGGRRTGAPDHWPAARKRFREDLAGLPDSARRIETPEPVRPTRSKALDHLTASVRAGIEVRRCPGHRTAPSKMAAPHSATLSVSGH